MPVTLEEAKALPGAKVETKQVHGVTVTIVKTQRKEYIYRYDSSGQTQTQTYYSTQYQYDNGQLKAIRTYAPEKVWTTKKGGYGQEVEQVREEVIKGDTIVSRDIESGRVVGRFVPGQREARKLQQAQAGLIKPKESRKELIEKARKGGFIKDDSRTSFQKELAGAKTEEERRDIRFRGRDVQAQQEAQLRKILGVKREEKTPRYVEELTPAQARILGIKTEKIGGKEVVLSIQKPTPIQKDIWQKRQDIYEKTGGYIPGSIAAREYAAGKRPMEQPRPLADLPLPVQTRVGMFLEKTTGKQLLRYPEPRKPAGGVVTPLPKGASLKMLPSPERTDLLLQSYKGRFGETRYVATPRSEPRITSYEEYRAYQERKALGGLGVGLQAAHKGLKFIDIQLRKAPVLYPVTSFVSGVGVGALEGVRALSMPARTIQDVKYMVSDPYAVGAAIGERLIIKGPAFVAGEFYGFGKVTEPVVRPLVKLPESVVVKGYRATKAGVEAFKEARLIRQINKRFKGKLVVREQLLPALRERGLSREIAVDPIESYQARYKGLVDEKGLAYTEAKVELKLGKRVYIRPEDVPSYEFVRFKGAGRKIEYAGKRPYSTKEAFPGYEPVKVSREVSPTTRGQVVSMPVKVDTVFTARSFFDFISVERAGIRTFPKGFGLERLTKTPSGYKITYTGISQFPQKIPGVAMRGIVSRGRISGFDYPPGTGKSLVPKSRAGPKGPRYPKDDVTQDFLRVKGKRFKQIPGEELVTTPYFVGIGKPYPASMRGVALAGVKQTLYVWAGMKSPRVLRTAFRAFRGIPKVKVPKGAGAGFKVIRKDGFDMPKPKKPKKGEDFVERRDPVTGTVTVQILKKPKTAQKTFTVSKQKTKQQYKQKLKYGVSSSKFAEMSKVGVKSESLSKSLVAGTKQFTKTMQRSRTKSKTKTKQEQIALSISRSRQGSMYDSLRAYKRAYEFAKAQAQMQEFQRAKARTRAMIPLQDVGQDTVSAFDFPRPPITDILSIPDTFPKIKGVFAGRPRKPTRPKGIRPSGTPSKEMKREYMPYAKEKGKWVKASRKYMTKQEAKERAEDVTDNTVARSWKVLTKNKGFARYKEGQVSGKFRRKKRKPKQVWVEKSRHSIDTFGELQGITVKGWLAKKKKAMEERGFIRGLMGF